MIDYRNSNRSGHILTLEDPIEYLFEHKQSIVNQREIGIDTQGYHRALPNALREAPDLIMIGEVRDRETMQHALLHTLTGHLCLSTLHANNSYHALSRIINMFPYDARSGLLSDLSIGLRAIISQRLVRTADGKGRRAAIEILINTPIIADKLLKGEFHEIKAIMGKSRELGMRTFDLSLFDLYSEGAITLDEAIRNADSANELRLNIKLNAKSPAQTQTMTSLSLEPNPEDEKDDAAAA
jgi:twitching motility protein PilU